MKKYIVRDGDTMWNISKITGVRLNLLMAANPQVHDPNRLQSGSVLSIPELGKEATASTEAVGAADTGPGPQIGGPHAHGTTKAVKAETPTAVHGQAHLATAPYFGFVWPHVIQPGENWDTVAGMYNVPVDSLRRMNPRQSSSLLPGEVIYVPGSAGQVPAGVPAPHSQQVPQQPSQVPAYGYGAAQQLPQMPGYSGGAMPQMPGYSGGAMPQMPGYSGGAMPQMPGYSGGAMPQMPSYPADATGVPQTAGYGTQWPALPSYPQGDGPHTHNPIRNAWYDNMVLPPYPVYVPGEPNTRADYGVPLRDLNGYDGNHATPEDLWQESVSGWRADHESEGTFLYREGSDSSKEGQSEAPRRPSETWRWPDALKDKDTSSRDLPDAEG